ncbi:MAG TPA: hypothetical protein VFZ63_00350 [Jiangellaceae bacterium]
MTTSFASFVIWPLLPPDDVLGPSSGGSESDVVDGGLESDSVGEGVGSSVGVSVGVSVGAGLTVAVALVSAAAASGDGADVGGEVCHGQ